MSDKKRRSRVQGGWAVPSSTSRKSSEREKTKSDGSSSSNYQFKPTIQIKTRPEDVIIKKDGVHEISTTKNGVSKIILETSFIDKDECDWIFEQLLNEVPWKQEYIKIKGERVAQPRHTAWYGNMNYTYSGLTLTPYQFSPLLQMLKDKIELFIKDHNLDVHFNTMLANLYRGEKDSIDWHSDDENSLGQNPIIASLSFGDTRSFELRKKDENRVQVADDDYEYAQHVKIPLSSGTLLVMTGSMQADWQHRVPKEYHDREERINLTYRTIYTDGN